MTDNKDFAQAPYYLSTFRHLQVRALQMVKNHFVQSLGQCVQQIRAELSSSQGTRPQIVLSDAEEASYLFARFQAVSPPLKLLMEELESRQNRKELSEMLVECYQSYFRARMDLMWDFVNAKIASTSSAVTNSASDSDPQALARFTRSACVYIKGLCRQELKLFCEFFQLPTSDTGHNEGPNTRVNITAHLANLAMPLTDTLRPLIIREPNTDVLCAVMEVLRTERAAVKTAIKVSIQQAEAASPSARRSRDDALLSRRHSSSSDIRKGAAAPSSTSSAGSVELVVASSVIKGLLCDVQERLIYRVQLRLRDEILGYEPTDAVLDYPNILTSQQQSRDTAEIVFPPLNSTLLLLSRLYQCLDVRIFEGLAHDLVDACSSSLFAATDKIRKRSSRTNKDEKALDALLFLIRNLLTLREQIAPLDVNFAFVERTIDFKNMRDYLGNLLQSPRSLLNIKQLTYALTGFIGEVRVLETKQDPKKEIERSLKDACEQFINTAAVQLAGDLLALLAHVSSSVKSQRAVQDSVTVPLENISKVLLQVKPALEEHVPRVVSQMAIYLPDPSTQSVLFKPIKTQIIEAYGSLLSFVQTAFLEDQWRPYNLPDTNQIADTFVVSFSKR
eukprot:c4588_g1_i1.p1 GENE.c4588_g1_i1~~c4588_g1_i1.p1  ORF type:complete len:618 (+),score=141.46 c4588_g1_i1:614-2467(+)